MGFPPRAKWLGCKELRLSPDPEQRGAGSPCLALLPSLAHGPTVADQLAPAAAQLMRHSTTRNQHTKTKHEEKGDGWELGVANLFYVRRGHVEALYGDIDGDTKGWGLNVQAGRIGGFRYDRAEVPQAS